MEEEEAEVEQAPRDGSAVDEDVLVRQMPSSRPHGQGCDVVVQAGTRDRPGAVNSIVRSIDVDQVRVAADDVHPGGRVGVLEVGHESPGARVQGVDDHLPVDGPGDLDAPVVKVMGRRLDLPLALAHLASLGQEVECATPIELRLPFCPALQ